MSNILTIPRDRLYFMGELTRAVDRRLHIAEIAHNDEFSDLIAMSISAPYNRHGDYMSDKLREPGFSVYHTAFNTQKVDETMPLPIVQLTGAHGGIKGIVNRARVSYYPPGHKKATGGPVTEDDVRLMTRLLKENHGCYDAKTEVLTHNGWKFWPEVTEYDCIAAVSIDTGDMRWEEPERLIKRPLKKNEAMLHFESDRIDMMVTKDHKMAGRFNGNENWSLETAKDLVGMRVEWMLAPFDGVESQPCHDRLRALAWMTGQRMVCGPIYNRSAFNVPADLAEYLSDKDNWESAVKGAESNYESFQESKEDGFKYVYALVQSELDALILGAADPSERGPSFRADHFYHLKGITGLDNDILQFAVARRGIATRIAKIRNKPTVIAYGRVESKYLILDDIEKGSALRNKTGLPTCYVTECELTEIEDRNVYCATVSTGAMLIRRNGKVIVCGNSPLEHNILSFRVLVPHPIFVQQLRHRPGWAYNAASGRYSNLSDYIYVPSRLWKQSERSHQGNKFELVGNNNPLSSAPKHDHIREHFLRQAIGMNQFYNQLINDVGMAKEQARFLMPFGNYAYAYVSCNMRALLHFLNLRVEHHAQFEMQQYAMSMALCAHYAMPGFFDILLNANVGLLLPEVEKKLRAVIWPENRAITTLEDGKVIDAEYWTVSEQEKRIRHYEKGIRTTNYKIRLADMGY